MLSGVDYLSARPATGHQRHARRDAWGPPRRSTDTPGRRSGRKTGVCRPQDVVSGDVRSRAVVAALTTPIRGVGLAAAATVLSRAVGCAEEVGRCARL